MIENNEQAQRIEFLLNNPEVLYKNNPASHSLNRCVKLADDFIRWSKTQGSGALLTLSTFIDDFGYNESEPVETCKLVEKIIDIKSNKIGNTLAKQ